MRKLPAVEEAKALMTEAQDWSLWRWLLERGKLRVAADAAWTALGEMEQKVKSTWPDELAQAYEEINADDPRGRKRGRQEHKSPSRRINANTKAVAQTLKEAADEAYRAHMEAEAVFDDAEKRMSTSRAREGAAKAVEAWELTEQALRKAEQAVKSLSGKD